MSMETAGERARNLPEIIQGGMGIAVSNWKLAGAVAAAGEMGIVSGTVIGPVLARRLQDGDQGGHIQQALEAFPDQNIASKIFDRYYLQNGRQPGKPYKAVPMVDARGHDAAVNLNMLGAFAEVWLAKQLAKKNENKSGPVGMNLLTKLEPPTLSALYGAMLAGVDYIIMGAGIPRDIPKAIANLSNGDPATIDFHVTGAEKSYNLEFNPANYSSLRDIPIMTPAFLAIISSHVLAKRLATNDNPPDGFVIEGPTAGGHNAPPRSKELDEHNQPFYGPKDEVNLEEMRKLKLPFWLAGSYGNPEGLIMAIGEGAKGIQVGSAFALCQESGLSLEKRTNIIDKALDEGIDVKTDFRASPTGFPFKVPAIEGTLSEDVIYKTRERICDLGYLREAYAQKDSAGQETVGYRCASEPVDDYLKKGGELVATIGRKCLCNGLMSAIDLGQLRGNGEQEPAIFTIGDNVNDAARRIVTIHGRDFSAGDIINYLRNEPRSQLK